MKETPTPNCLLLMTGVIHQHLRTGSPRNTSAGGGIRLAATGYLSSFAVILCIGAAGSHYLHVPLACLETPAKSVG